MNPLRPKSLAIIHFGDISVYPPAFNLVRYFSASKKYSRILVSSRSRFDERLDNVSYWNSVGFAHVIRVLRLPSYIYFYVKAFCCLVFNRPSHVIYYESLSYPPVYFYQRLMHLFKRKIHIYCHYHEYTAPEDYEKGMALDRFSHRLEVRSYSVFSWISHTNAYRKALFLENHAKVNPAINFIFPNYPPRSWKRYVATNLPVKAEQTLRIVYLGSLDIVSMYAPEICNWVIKQNGAVALDIYSHQFDSSTERYFCELNSAHINLKRAIDYDRLPETLVHYDVGVILYKGLTKNYIYNAPNKYFEYAACGLDVWYPREMTGMKSYRQTIHKPTVLELDFNNLPENLLQIAKAEREFVPTVHPEAEDVFDHLLKYIDSRD